MVSSSKPHHPSRRSRRTAAVITASLLTSSVSPVTAFAQDPFKDANNLVQGLAGNLPQAPAMPVARSEQRHAGAAPSRAARFRRR